MASWARRRPGFGQDVGANCPLRNASGRARERRPARPSAHPPLIRLYIAQIRAGSWGVLRLGILQCCGSILETAVFSRMVVERCSMASQRTSHNAWWLQVNVGCGGPNASRARSGPRHPSAPPSESGWPAPSSVCPPPPSVRPPPPSVCPPLPSVCAPPPPVCHPLAHGPLARCACRHPRRQHQQDRKSVV